MTVCFAYSIPFPKIIFTKAHSTSDSLDAHLALSVDAADSVTGTNYHKFHSKTISVNAFSLTQDPKLSSKDFVVMDLPKSTYRVTAEARDDNQQIPYFSHTFREHFSYPSGPTILSTIFLDSLAGNRLFPELINNVAAFPRNVTVAILAKDSSFTKLTLTLKTKTGGVIHSFDSLTPLKARLEPGDSNDIFSFAEMPDSAYSLYIARFEIDTLSEGMYELEASFGGRNKKLDFSYLWLDKPLTLRNFAMALSLLKYIAPDSVYSLINSGNDKEEREKFDLFWKSHDPTPNTAYNELETEFYQRADYALEHFRTVVTSNGAATDRGKAYILFGQPASIKREFRSDGTYEIWYYPNLKSVLVFREQRFGEFKLFQTEKL